MLQTENNLQEYKAKSLYSELTVFFQPIFSSIKGKIFGYEALMRHKRKNLNVKNFFSEAKKNGSIFILDIICRRNAIKEASKQNLKDFLFINIRPETLFYPQHEIGVTDQFAEEFSFPKDRIVLEITEELAIEHYELFVSSLSYYKNRGYKIAIDNFGSNLGGPKLLSLLEPDIVKIDKQFIYTIENNYFSKSFIEFTLKACQKLNIKVVVQGIENSTQLSEVINIGADLLQGYYLGQPKAKIKSFTQPNSDGNQ